MICKFMKCQQPTSAFQWTTTRRSSINCVHFCPGELLIFLVGLPSGEVGFLQCSAASCMCSDAAHTVPVLPSAGAGALPGRRTVRRTVSGDQRQLSTVSPHLHASGEHSFLPFHGSDESFHLETSRVEKWLGIQKASRHPAPELRPVVQPRSRGLPKLRGIVAHIRATAPIPRPGPVSHAM